MWPFDNSGCDKHHWDDGRDLDEYRIHSPGPWGGIDWRVQKRHERRCEHAGCDATTRRWVTIDTAIRRSQARESLAEYLTGGDEA
jgi:hypothetical protein